MAEQAKYKTTHSQAVEMAKGNMELVQQWIDEGLVGNPGANRTKAWQFEGTDRTFYRGSSKSEKSVAKGANNTMTPEIEKIERVIALTNDVRYDLLRKLQETGAFGNPEKVAEQLSTKMENTIMRFLNSNEG